jgi:hypothetical protein
MSQPPAPRISDEDDNDVSTPILIHLPASPPRPSSLLPSGSTVSESTKPAAVLPSNAHLRLPIPTPSANLSQTSFTFVDVTEDGGGVDFEDLPPEVTSADISIAREFLYSTSRLTALRLLCAYIAICRGAPQCLGGFVYEMEVRRCIPRTLPLEPFGTRLHFPVPHPSEASIFGYRFNFISGALDHVGAR